MQRLNKILIVTDTHFSPVKKNNEIEIFCDFLRRNLDYDVLFLLGDIFDYYYEYKYFIPKNYFKVFETVSYLSQKIKIHYWPGNHDFWHLDFFKDIGVEIHYKPTVLNINSKKFLIAHGDNLKKDDFFNSFIKNGITQWLYRKFHPDFSYEIGRFISKLSSSKNKKIKLNKYIDFAQKNFNKGIDVVIIGHVHKQCKYKKNRNIFIIVGAWKERRYYCEISDGNVFLRCDTQSPR